MSKSHVYLICASRPLRNRTRSGREYFVSHYIGRTSKPVDERLLEHSSCAQHPPGDEHVGCFAEFEETRRSAKLCAALVRNGAVLSITRTWAGGEKVERAVKNYGKAYRLCPRCAGKVAMYRRPKGVKRGKNVYKAALAPKVDGLCSSVTLDESESVC